MNKFLATSQEWDWLTEQIRRRKLIGLDTEFYGLDITKESCVHRARIHVWSIALRSTHFDARGYHKAVGFVLPSAALSHPGLCDVLGDRAIRKAVHNQPVDAHAFANHGIALRGGINTLNLARWVWPEMNKVPGYTLKSLMTTKLGREPITTFKKLLYREWLEPYSLWKKVETKVCDCGVVKCRKRKGHTKTAVVEDLEVIKERKHRGSYNLDEIVPGHERWELLVDYAAEDAIAALELLEIALRTPAPGPYTYPSGGPGSECPPRPTFNQAVEEELIEMERTGFRVDVGYCAFQSGRASTDEQACLEEMRGWWGAHVSDPRSNEDIDAIWSSPKQLVAFLDSRGVPRSPIWGKGLVKKGEVKTDRVALEWVLKSCRASQSAVAELLALLLHLRKIRSGKKYVDKLPRYIASDGCVHPVTGPAGDEDDAVGAQSGRLGMKHPEGQQLPKPDEDEAEVKKDLYGVRRAIIA